MTNHSDAPSGIRIRPWPVKLACVVVAFAVVELVGYVPAGTYGTGILRSAVLFVLVILGTRVFRGADEEVAPPRPLWRMTGGVQSGIVLGAVFGLEAILSAAGFVGITFSPGIRDETPELPALLVNAVLSAILAYLYFRSSRRIVLARREELIALARKAR